MSKLLQLPVNVNNIGRWIFFFNKVHQLKHDVTFTNPSLPGQDFYNLFTYKGFYFLSVNWTDNIFHFMLFNVQRTKVTNINYLSCIKYKRVFYLNFIKYILWPLIGPINFHIFITQSTLLN